jgi:dihydrofolate reductase
MATMAIRVHTSMTLDGFSADTNGWPVLLHMPDFVPGVSYGHEEFFAQCTAVIMGRRTYEPALGAPDWPWPGKKVFVLTSGSVEVPTDQDVTVCAGVDEVLAALPAGDAQLLGGPSTIAAFHRAGAVDRFEIVLLPLLLGKGNPLFPLGEDTQPLAFEEQVVYPDGTVKLCYGVRTALP